MNTVPYCPMDDSDDGAKISTLREMTGLAVRYGMVAEVLWSLMNALSSKVPEEAFVEELHHALREWDV